MKEEVVIKVEGKEWKDLVEASFDTVIKDVKIDGFRKGKAPRNVYEKKYGKHPTQKPEYLLERIMQASTKENFVVLDPFCGSATTAIAALRNNCYFIGIDNIKEYLEIAQRRIENEFALFL